MGETKILSRVRPWDRCYAAALLLLALLPDVLSMINLTTPWGFKIHTFQAAIFLAAALPGPWGGLLSGLAGSLSAALIPALFISHTLWAIVFSPLREPLRRWLA